MAKVYMFGNSFICAECKYHLISRWVIEPSSKPWIEVDEGHTKDCSSYRKTYRIDVTEIELQLLDEKE